MNPNAGPGNCSSISELRQYLDRDLSGSEERGARVHLQDCRWCRSLLSEIRKENAGISSILPEWKLSPVLAREVAEVRQQYRISENIPGFLRSPTAFSRFIRKGFREAGLLEALLDPWVLVLGAVAFFAWIFTT